MNKRVWLFSILIALFVFCIQTLGAGAEDKAPQNSVGLTELAQGGTADGNLGSRVTGQFKGLTRAGESDYPPFFGDDTSSAQPGIQPGTQPGTQPGIQPGTQAGNGAAELTGTWAASDGQTSVIMMFQGSVCCVGYNTTRACGTFTAAGGKLTIHLQNGNVINFEYKVQGNQLILDNDTILIRQQVPAVPSPASPQQGSNWGQAVPSIDGTWSGGGITLMFQGGQYQVLRGGQVIESGTYQVSASAVQFQPAGMGPYVKQLRMDAQAIYLDNQRYDRQGGGSGGNWGGSSAPQGGNWGGSSAPQGNTWGTPAPSGASTILEGCWVSTNLPAVITFCFSGNQYRCTMANNPMVETGTFFLQGDQLHYTMATGATPGQRGTNRFSVNNNMLSITYPQGGTAVFRKQ
ncbi:MAG TPA: hypothetical protein IAB01_04705 [Candidatus Avidesulfovibrio excrementigallinarum]|nr:hypothetical protein [Candidatus Avidesulfovibrio excrementigallinarum]